MLRQGTIVLAALVWVLGAGCGAESDLIEGTQGAGEGDVQHPGDDTLDAGPNDDEGDEAPRRHAGDGEIPGSSHAPSGEGAGGLFGLDASDPSSGDWDGASGVADASGAASSAPSEPGHGGSGQAAEPGTLTAGTWDDNLNFGYFSAYRSELLQEGMRGAPPFADGEHLAALEHFGGTRGARTTLDISLVIDTTGSMGDELRYLQAEFLALSETIGNRYPDAEQRWSLVVYRDETDVYVVRWFDFREDNEEFRAHLAAQRARGGGDYPEASHRGLEAMNGLSWRTGADTARLAFWVADAPHHNQHAGAVAAAVRRAQELDIHIYPVASSGVDELTELTMRSAAQLTGGRYLFLTDDSGVGGSHKEPSIPCYFVTRLDHAILRMVDIELKGEHRPPEPAQIIRTGGDPQYGDCTLESGDQVTAF